MKTRPENWLREILEEASREVSEWPEWLREDMQRGARKAFVATSPVAQTGSEKATRATAAHAPKRARSSSKSA